MRRGYTTQDLAAAVQVSGLSNLSLSIAPQFAGRRDRDRPGDLQRSGLDGFGRSLVPHNGVVEIMAVGATVFGVNVPAQQIVQQIGSAIGQDPTNLNVGFTVDRLFACNSVLMIDGRHS